MLPGNWIANARLSAVTVPARPVLSPQEQGPKSRLVALDWMRGLVMVLMAVDHSSGEFNAGKLMADGAFMYKPGTPLPVDQFLTRWMTHLCAPTFVFLAGTAMALSIRRRSARGESAGSIDRHLFLRGLVITGFELVPSAFWLPPGRYLLQVLYAIGTSFLFMIPLRRLPVPAIVAVALGILLSSEAVIGLSGWGPPERTPLLAGLLLVPGYRGTIIVAYPTLHWLAMMLLGWAFGQTLSTQLAPALFARRLAVAGALLLAMLVVVRGANGYGNMSLLREGGSVVQWLHVSKYPPSFSFVTLELGLGALALGALTLIAMRVAASENGLLLVLGRTPMFFYLLHIPLLALVAKGLGLEHKLGLGAAYGFAALVIIVLYPVCRFYGRYKAAHPNGIVRYI